MNHSDGLSLTEDDDGNPLALREVPAGRITLRDARTNGRREVDLRPFAIGATTVTRAQWQTVHRPGPVTDPATTNHDSRLPAHQLTWFEAVTWCNAASTTQGIGAAYTIEGREVHWDVSSTGYRLPTEAEWEHACRAGTVGPRYGELTRIAWTAADRVSGVQPVASKEPNAFGLFDMIGNLWEWCWDYADTARYADYRSLRGAGWADPHYSARASVRRGSAPDARIEDVGLRVVRGAVGPEGSDLGQGWSAAADARRAAMAGPLPMGWTPLRGLKP
ncbi:formylglycine-generating enzyme family protein [Arthrobacter rhombi]|uniref:formylglycine-generating enzyme family protein n=1 Tax=Arthrobacter rhombi TaxID=71253 RepID=UPI003FD2248D